MISINSAFTRNNTINRKETNSDKLELSRAKSVAMKDLKLTQLEADVIDFSYNKSNALDFMLDDPEVETKKKVSEEHEDLTPFSNFFRDYELEENGPKDFLKEEMGEFYQETQYDEDDIPLGEDFRPFRQLSIGYFSPYRFAHDTDLDAESKHALHRINYSERIHARSRLKDDTSNVGEISELAACLSEKEGKHFADRCVDKSLLKLSNDVRYFDANLFRFVSKHPGHRNHVIKITEDGSEIYSPTYGRAYSRMLDETNDVNTIKRVLRSGVMFVDKDSERQDPVLTNFAVDVYKKTHNWGFEEKKLVELVKNRVKDPKTDLIKKESIDKNRLNKAKELLKTDASIEECIYEIDESLN